MKKPGGVSAQCRLPRSPRPGDTTMTPRKELNRYDCVGDNRCHAITYGESLPPLWTSLRDEEGTEIILCGDCTRERPRTAMPDRASPETTKDPRTLSIEVAGHWSLGASILLELLEKAQDTGATTATLADLESLAAGFTAATTGTVRQDCRCYKCRGVCSSCGNPSHMVVCLDCRDQAEKAAEKAQKDRERAARAT
jgi:hypothetical protein